MDESPIALVIGCGNTLRRDDSVGPRAAEAVAGWGFPGVASLAVHQLTPELAVLLARASVVVFVDARLADEEEPSRVEVSPIGPEAGTSSLGHAGNPRHLLALARDLFGRCPVAWLVTVPSTDFGIGEGLSPGAARGLDDALERIAVLLDSELKGPAESKRPACVESPGPHPSLPEITRAKP